MSIDVLHLILCVSATTKIRTKRLVSLIFFVPLHCQVVGYWNTKKQLNIVFFIRIDVICHFLVVPLPTK